jgi:cell division septal protein FtsQ
MAAKARRRTVTEKNTRTAGRRKTSKSRSRSVQGSRFGSFFLPLFLSICLLVCLSILGYLGLQSVTATKFFEVRAVSVSGTDRASEEDIRRISMQSAEKTGVWNADLPELKARLEKLPFVKTASVSRVLPDALSVTIEERIPIAVVKLSTGRMLVDNEGTLLATAAENEDRLPVMLFGWDEAKTESALKQNLDRVKTYQKMMTEWRDAGLLTRVNGVDLTDLREPKAVAEDSGLKVTIGVGRESFAQHLKNGISAIVGKGDQFEGVSLVGSNMILNSRKNNAAQQSAER